MSQESSPITQWQETVGITLSNYASCRDSIPHDLDEFAARMAVAFEGWDREQEPIDALSAQATEAITSATIELIEGLIPAKRKIPAFSFLRFNKYYGGDYAIVRDHGYNLAIDQLRQSLKELSNE